jgi:hypothetical protein
MAEVRLHWPHATGRKFRRRRLIGYRQCLAANHRRAVFHRREKNDENDYE